jgi:hypothetical protein
VLGRRKEEHGEEIEEHGKLEGDGEASLLAHLPKVEKSQE